jgi:hypothetical protein
MNPSRLVNPFVATSLDAWDFLNDFLNTSLQRSRESFEVSTRQDANCEDNPIKMQIHLASCVAGKFIHHPTLFARMRGKKRTVASSKEHGFAHGFPPSCVREGTQNGGATE